MNSDTWLSYFDGPPFKRLSTLILKYVKSNKIYVM